jgi:hypothetical protein
MAVVVTVSDIMVVEVVDASGVVVLTVPELT